ncbi:MAG: hypothetical protein ABFD92_19885 [Planctomycetaceae bacterium]|nr:hypothetical protein [Planctomycetaceae bacterium]
MNRTWMLASVAAFAAIIWLAGCSSTTTTEATMSPTDDDGRLDDAVLVPDLIPLATSPIADVPVPMGFKIKEKQTLEFGAGSARYLEHTYKGRADKWELNRFFRQQMQANRWQFINYLVTDGEFTLEFEKDNERCRIIIAGAAWYNFIHPTLITVRLWSTGPVEIRPADAARAVTRTGFSRAAPRSTRD